MESPSLIPHNVLEHLFQKHRGAVNGATAEALVHELVGIQDKALERQLRAIIVELRKFGAPICATPGEGYYVAANANELNNACKFLFDRAMTSLSQVAAMKKVALPDLAGQLGIPLDTPSNGDTP